MSSNQHPKPSRLRRFGTPSRSTFREQVTTLVSMGFAQEAVRAALVRHRNNTEAALDALLAGP